jgi:exosome complex component RRP43
LISANVISLDSLCIQPGKAVWVLYVDVTCINYDGNAFDAALVAMVAALKNGAHFALSRAPLDRRAATLPKATFSEETGQTTCTRRLREVLKVNRLPAAYTMGVFGGYVLAQVAECCLTDQLRPLFMSGCRNTLLLDPTAFEEPLLDASVTVVLDERHRLLSVSDIGYAGLPDEDHITECIKLAKLQHTLIVDTLYGG